MQFQQLIRSSTGQQLKCCTAQHPGYCSYRRQASRCNSVSGSRVNGWEPKGNEQALAPTQAVAAPEVLLANELAPEQQQHKGGAAQHVPHGSAAAQRQSLEAAATATMAAANSAVALAAAACVESADCAWLYDEKWVQVPSAPLVRLERAQAPDVAAALDTFCRIYRAGGEQLWLVGDGGSLGSWDPAAGAQMQWGEGHIWSVTLPFEQGATVAYKALLQLRDCEPKHWRWQAGGNCVTEARSDNSDGKPLQVMHDFH
ncbi:hypothetical protein COO60DRAFT_1627330 [Scenedesmus sp. NREL 46B-D3]|nr:hypothetical protein COO60DRAFT_1627330 [Scenedesmus sp. NREL 46B-D3]